MEPALLLLKDHFSRSFHSGGVVPPQGVFDALVARYREPHRSYHTLQHIGEGIAHLANVRNAPRAVGIAWWFHDAIYDPKRSDNEERSAAWAGAVLGKTALGAEVEKLVLATKHTTMASGPTSRLIVDVDLSILAVPEPRYSEYEAQIRKEFAFVDDVSYRTERMKVLRSFYDRAYIFATPDFHKLESRARRNLERTINILRMAK